MAGAGGEEPGLSLEDSPQTPPVIEGSLFTFGTQQNGVVDSHLSCSLHNDVDPKESLTSLRSISSVTAMHHMPEYDVVYQMLQERERDLELAARIGQALLQRNEMLEADLSTAVDLRQRHEHQIAQLKHDLVKKEALVQLYLEDVNERENQLKNGNHSAEGESEPSWVRELAVECQQLRESNESLHLETEKLRKETQDIELKERDVLQLCLDQLTTTKHNLGGLRQEVEQRSAENHQLRVQFEELSARQRHEQGELNQLLSENEDLKEKLLDLEATHSVAITEMTALQQRCEQCAALLEEKQSEIQRLKEISGCRSAPSELAEGSESFLGAVEHESIVHEIEEALRKEIIAASTLSERPRSPNHYAQQRTMVVMETVRAATMATAKRRERLKHEQDQSEDGSHGSKGMVELAIPSISQDSRGLLTPPKTFSPLPRGKSAIFSSANLQRSFTPKNSSSPLLSKNSPQSTEDSLTKHRTHSFFLPEKLQIVKPMEGSVTLLRWKLLASPQLGGAKAYFSAASPPGVRVKGWSIAGIHDDCSPPRPESNTSLHVTSSISGGFADLSNLEATNSTPTHVGKSPPSIQTPIRDSSLIGRAKGWLGFGTDSPSTVCNDSGIMSTPFSAITDVQ